MATEHGIGVDLPQIFPPNSDHPQMLYQIGQKRPHDEDGPEPDEQARFMIPPPRPDPSLQLLQHPPPTFVPRPLDLGTQEMAPDSNPCVATNDSSEQPPPAVFAGSMAAIPPGAIGTIDAQPPSHWGMVSHVQLMPLYSGADNAPKVVPSELPEAPPPVCVDANARVKCSTTGQGGRVYASQKLWKKYGEKLVQPGRNQQGNHGGRCVKRAYYRCFQKDCPARLSIDTDTSTKEVAQPELTGGDHTHSFEIIDGSETQSKAKNARTLACRSATGGDQYVNVVHFQGTPL